MAAAVGPRTRLVMICSPNNPTGTVVTRDELERFLAAVPADVLVALDEAYHEFVTDPAAANGTELLDTYPNLVVLRTFSKAYRLAGLRVGYAIGSPEVATALRKVCSPFSVNSVAQAAAIAALDDADNLLAGCAEVITERVRVRDALVAPGTRCRRRSPTSSGWRWASGPRRSLRTAWSTRWWSGRSTRTGCGSPSRRRRRTTCSSPRPASFSG